MILFIAGGVTFAVLELGLAFAIAPTRRHLLALWRAA